MRIRGLMLAVIVLAGLSGALYWSSKHKPTSAAEASSDIPPKILTLNEADISKIGIRKKGGDEVTLAKDSAGKWQISAPKALGADQDAVSSMLSTVSSLSADRLVEDKTDNVAQFGLTEPALTVNVVEKGNKTHALLVGDDTPASGGAFAKIEGDPRVFTVASYTKTSLDKGVNDLRDKRLLTIETDKVSRLELIASKQDIEFGRDKDQWQILKPKPLRADGSTVDELVRKLADAKMNLTSADDPKKTASAFAVAKALATAKVTTPSGTQELQVRKNKDDYYAKSSVVEGIYKVASDLGQGLDKKLEDFRNKKLFNFGFNDPNKVEVHDGTKAYFLTKSGDDWWSGDSKKLDAIGVSTLVDRIRDLQASKFVESGFTTPAINVSVTSGDGKRLEKVLISKNGNNYIGRRENEAALYALDSKTVEELQKSAAELKPQK